MCATLVPPTDLNELIGWEMQLPGIISAEVPTAEHPVRLQRIWGAADNQHICGSISVCDLAFGKTVALRYTVDNWRVVSERLAHYSSSAPGTSSEAAYDRFEFSVDLNDLPRRKTTLQLCVRYRVNDQDFWDNNDGANYEIVLSPTGTTRSDEQVQYRSQPPFDDAIEDRHLRMLLSLQRDREAEDAGQDRQATLPQTIHLHTAEYNTLIQEYCFYDGGPPELHAEADYAMRLDSED